MDVGAEALAEGVFESTVTITVTAKVKDKVAFLVEGKQAGIFGELIDVQLQPNPAINGWRLTLRVKIRNVAQAVELRAALSANGKPLTETWSYQLPPRSDVQRTF